MIRAWLACVLLLLCAHSAWACTCSVPLGETYRGLFAKSRWAFEGRVEKVEPLPGDPTFGRATIVASNVIKGDVPARIVVVNTNPSTCGLSFSTDGSILPFVLSAQMVEEAIKSDPPTLSRYGYCDHMVSDLVLKRRDEDGPSDPDDEGPRRSPEETVALFSGDWWSDECLHIRLDVRPGKDRYDRNLAGEILSSPKYPGSPVRLIGRARHELVYFSEQRRDGGFLRSEQIDHRDHMVGRGRRR